MQEAYNSSFHVWKRVDLGFSFCAAIRIFRMTCYIRHVMLHVTCHVRHFMLYVTCHVKKIISDSATCIFHMTYYIYKRSISYDKWRRHFDLALSDAAKLSASDPGRFQTGSNTGYGISIWDIYIIHYVIHRSRKFSPSQRDSVIVNSYSNFDRKLTLHDFIVHVTPSFHITYHIYFPYYIVHLSPHSSSHHWHL